MTGGERRHVPRCCVWEITLACNAHCIHCGSTAGRPRDAELDTEEAISVIEQLADLGCESITLSGGEPLLREDWPRLARAIRDRGMEPELISNGLLVAEQADVIAGAGLTGVTMSVDGADAATHDGQRGVTGSLDRVLEGAAALLERGQRVGATTQINRRNLDQLPQLLELLRAHGFDGWQLQITMPQGRARRAGADLCLAPEQLPALEDTILELKARAGDLSVQVSDNIGYMSRREPDLRTDVGQPKRFWSGCGAGLTVIGLTSDGTVRGCLSLPPDLNEKNGNVRDRPLIEIWRDPDGFAYNRRFDAGRLTGPCAGCAFGKICRAGCTSLAWATTGTTTANTHCIYSVNSRSSSANDR